MKLLKGTDRSERMRDEPQFELTNNAQPPFRLRGPVACAEWERLVAHLENQRVLTHLDLPMLAVAVNHYDDIQRTWEAGESPKAAALSANLGETRNE